MALIGKIRQKAGWAVGFVAVGLGLFMVGGDILGPNSAIMGKNKTDVGDIAGETIELERYQQQIDEIKYNYTINYGRNPSENEMHTIRQQAWEYLIVKIAFQEQYDKLGLVVTDEEQWDMVQGNNVSFEIKQAFTDPQTGEFQRDRVISYLQQVKQLSPEQQSAWFLFEQNLKPSRHRIKYDNLLVKTTYATEVEAKRRYQEETAVAEIRYLYIPYYSLADSSVTVTDNDLMTYLKAHQSEYKVEESRSFSYISIPIVPSGDDTTYFMGQMNKLKEEFRATEDDSLFARNNSDGATFFDRLGVDALPNILQANYSNLSIGDVRGPYFEDGNFVIYKIAGITEDTVGAVKASHILIKWDDESEAAKAAARSKAQGILNKARAGEDFAQLARENSVDGSAQSGGDLGWFGKGKMVEPFENAVFGASSAGVINRLVESQFGFHIIKVTEPVNNSKFDIAHIQRIITPSETTKNKAFRTADFFASSSSNYEEFTENAAKDSLEVFLAENIGKNDRRFNEVDNARQVIQWIFKEEDTGGVSDVIELDDSYIIASVTKITEEGTATLADVRGQLEPKVKNEKKADVIVEKLGKADGSLEELKSNYGADANIYTSSDLKISANSLPTVGFAPLAIGTAFSLEPGQKSNIVREENGILIIEMVNFTKAPDIADYTPYKAQIEQRVSGRVSFDASEAIKKFADIEDERYRFF
jgi:peptidyl-prolyl cis-trans isomerase D